MSTFFQRLEQRAENADSLLCVGLDPRISSEPAGIRTVHADAPASSAIGRAILSQNRRIIEETAEFAAAFKPNIAYYEAWGSVGLAALEETIRLIPGDIPIVLDAKRGDIGTTAEAYARSAFGHFGADAVTVNPYLGKEAIDPFLAYEDRGLFVVCRTSNPGSDRLQKIPVAAADTQPFFLAVAAETLAWSDRIGLVVAANDLQALELVRASHPEAWFLAPGVGKQGGKAGDSVSAGVRGDGLGILVVAARAVAESDHPGETARAMRDEMNRAREAIGHRGGRRNDSTVARSGGKTADAEGVSGEAARVDAAASGADTVGTDPENRARRAIDQGNGYDAFPKTQWREPGLNHLGGEDASVNRKRMVLHGLVRTGCFRVGEFVLKSGITSPFYVDLRRTISDPVFLKLVAQAYAEISRDIDFARIAGVPMAALPIAAAVSLETGIPMIYPRLPAKPHGTGNRIEGEYEPGERVLLLDDLITTGLSKMEATNLLREEGLIVTDLVVLLERSANGRKDLASEGISVHSYVRVDELFETCREMGVISADGQALMRAFVQQGN